MVSIKPPAAFAAAPSCQGRSFRKRVRGLTWVEVMLGLATGLLFLGLFAAASVHYFRGLPESANAVARMDSQTHILNSLARDLRSASAGKVTAAGAQLTLQLPSLKEEVGASVAQQVTYRTQGGYFQRENGPRVQLLAAVPSGSSVHFAYLGSGLGKLPPIVATFKVPQPQPKQALTYVARRTFSPPANATLLP